MKNGEVILTLLPSTPLSTEELTAILDVRLKMLSEFQIGILMERKGWQADLKMICGYLQKLSRSLILKQV
jgi:hypothetical protein